MSKREGEREREINYYIYMYVCDITLHYSSRLEFCIISSTLLLFVGETLGLIKCWKVTRSVSNAHKLACGYHRFFALSLVIVLH